MASSPTESAAEELLGGIGDCYERADHAVGEDDLDLVQELVDEVDAALRSLPTMSSPSAAELSGFERATAAHGRLMDALARTHEDTRGALSRVRQGHKLLAAYGGRLVGTGIRIERDG